MKNKLKSIFTGYEPDYIDICRFKNEFEKFEADISLLRGWIFQWLDRKDDDEVKDIETKLIVEIEEINKMTMSITILPLITFVLGIIGKMYEAIGILYFFIMLVLFGMIIMTLGIRRSMGYHKYYIFLKEMIKRYKKEDSK